MRPTNIRLYNRAAWDRQVEQGNPWTVPVSPEQTAAARQGVWQVFLTPTKPVPRDWFPPLAGCDLLCLASGGGQQGPIFAAAGANVTVLDNSPRQLGRDREVADRDGLKITTLEGDMADLSALGDESFDLVFHPVSNVFAPHILPVWREAYRVLRRGGVLLAGFGNPLVYLFDMKLAEQGILQVKHTLPYSDVESLSDEEMQAYLRDGVPMEFSHTLQEQIGGQLEAGFYLIGFFEDIDSDPQELISRYTPIYIATRAVKP